jgi:ubiquinone biosynthesis protein
MCPSYHNVDEFATALRAVGEPTRGKPVSELSVGQMLDSLFAITRDFDMQTQPHLLLLQKTMVMVEGVATSLNPAINMWEVSAPFVREWIRDELGPEAAIADGLRDRVKTLALIPDLIKRLDDQLPRKGRRSPCPPVPAIPLIWEEAQGSGNGGAIWACIALLAAAAGAAGMWALG